MFTLAVASSESVQGKMIICRMCALAVASLLMMLCRETLALYFWSEPHSRPNWTCINVMCDVAGRTSSRKKERRGHWTQMKMVRGHQRRSSGRCHHIMLAKRQENERKWVLMKIARGCTALHWLAITSNCTNYI